MTTGMSVYFAVTRVLCSVSPGNTRKGHRVNTPRREPILSAFDSDDLAHVAQVLNSRPSKALGWENPAERFNSYIQLH